MRTGIFLKQSNCQRMIYHAKLAKVIEMPGMEYAELIREIESDPVFVRLRYSDDLTERAVRMRRLSRTGLSSKFFEFKDELGSYEGSSSAEVERMLEDKEKLVNTIRRLGEDKFRRYFLLNDERLSCSEICAACGISAAEARNIFSLVNSVDVLNEFFVPAKVSPEISLSYNLIASLVKGQKGYILQFMSVNWARGIYEIDYDKIKQFKNNGKYSKDELNSIRKLIEKMEFINMRKSLIHSIILKIVDRQIKYLNSGGSSGLEPLRQVELACDIGVHPSLISRAIMGRCIEMPWGAQKPLKEFFISDLSIKREKVLGCIRKILENEKIYIAKNINKKLLSDRSISILLEREYCMSIAPRTVAKYRSMMKLPNAFNRLKSV